MPRKTPNDLDLENLDNENENENEVTELVQWPDWTYVEKEKKKKTAETAIQTPKKEAWEVLTADTWGLEKLWNLTPEQLARKDEMKSSIDINDSMSIIEYWVEEQTEIKSTIQALTRSKKTKDFQVVWTEIKELNKKLRTQWQKESSSMIVRVFRNLKEKALTKRDEIATLEKNITAVEDLIKEHIWILWEDIEWLENLWEINKNRFYELELLRRAWLEKIEEVKDDILAKTKEFQESDGKIDEMEKQELQKMYKGLALLEKKVHDLHVSQILAVQTAQEIQMIKGCDVSLKELMQETIVTNIPVWRMQWALNSATEDAQFVADIHKSVSEATNQMLIRNAELLWALTVDVATEAEKPVVEHATLDKVYHIIWDALSDIVKIAEEWDRQRKEWEKKLQELERKLITTGEPKRLWGKKNK